MDGWTGTTGLYKKLCQVFNLSTYQLFAKWQLVNRRNERGHSAPTLHTSFLSSLTGLHWAFRFVWSNNRRGNSCACTHSAQRNDSVTSVRCTFPLLSSSSLFHVAHSDFLESDWTVVQFSVKVTDLFCFNHTGYALQIHVNYNYSYENSVREADETKKKKKQ